MIKYIKRLIKLALFGPRPPRPVLRPPRSVEDLAKLGPMASLPDAKFARARDSSANIEGMFSEFSMALIDSLLAFQTEAGISGDVMEMGVYKGRSAALMSHRLEKNETLVLVDVEDCLDRTAIADVKDRVELVIASTQDLRDKLPDYRSRRGLFRFVHIDASHRFKPTFTELGIAEELLGNRGIIAMDDFTNLNFAENMAAIFCYLYTAETHLRIFLVTNDKAYLCRDGDFDFYADFILGGLLTDMAARGQKDCVVARTDCEPQFKAYYLRGQERGETGSMYAPNIYLNQILAR